MSVLEVNKIDGTGLISDGKGIALFISDHLGWEKEYEHLLILQKKINSYIAFCESQQYKKVYPNKNILYAVIEIHFLYEPTKKCVDFLNQVQKQVGELGIKITCYVE